MWNRPRRHRRRPAHRRAWIREGVFEDQDFAAESFDLICCFMTMEHVLDPKVIAPQPLSCFVRAERSSPSPTTIGAG